MAGDAQVQQLVLQVAANVAVAQRSLADLARSVQTDSASMNASLDTTAKAQERLGLAFNQTRIAQMELSHVITASVDAYAAGYNPLRILTLEMGRLAQAATFLGGVGGGGIMGGFARFMSGPWGLAILLGTAALSQLVFKSHETGTSVDDLLQKMRKHAQEAMNQETANKIWANSLDGVREAQQKLREELQKSLEVEAVVRQQELDNSVAAVKKYQETLSKAQNRRATLVQQLFGLESGSISATGNNANIPLEAQQQAQQAAIEKTRAEIKALDDQIKTLNADIAKSSANIVDAQQKIGNASADASAKASAAVQETLQSFEGLLNIEVQHGVISTDASKLARAAMESYAEAIDSAAAAGLNFRQIGATAEILKMASGFAHGKIDAQAFTKAVNQATNALREAAAAAKGNPITEFKNAVFGAEGTGQNPSSSAFGFGQFTKGTWLSYFNKIFPSYADLSDAAKLEFRSVKSTAEAVLDQATKDYISVLKSAGQQITAANLYAVHVLGGPDAMKFFSHAPGDLTSSFLKPSVIKGNGNLLTGTVAQVEAKLAARIGGSSSKVTQGLQAITKTLQDQQEQADQFGRQSAQLDAELLSAQRQLVAGYDTQAELKSQEVEAQRQSLQYDVQRRLDEGKLNDLQARQLSDQINQVAAAKQAVIAFQEYVNHLKQLDDSSKLLLDQRIGDLQFSEKIARSQEARRKLELDIIDIQYQEKAQHLQMLLTLIKLNKDFATSADLQQQAANIQMQLAHIPTEKQQATYNAIQDTLTPLQQWAKDLPQNAQEINDQLQSITAKGLDGLANAITNVVTGTESMKQAFHDLAQSVVSDILQMIIKMLIFRALSSVFGSAFSGGGDFSSTLSFNSGWASANSGLVVPARAGGGPVNRNMPYIVGENGPELFIPKSSGMIIPNQPHMNIPAANSNGFGVTEVHVIVDTSDDLVVKTAAIADDRINRAAPVIVKAAVQGTLRAASRPKLMGRR